MRFKVALLHRRQLVINQNQGKFKLGHFLLNFVGLAGADEKTRVGGIRARPKFGLNLCACGSGKLAKLLRRFHFVRPTPGLHDQRIFTGLLALKHH